jgi:hypothetical protein
MRLSKDVAFLHRRGPIWHNRAIFQIAIGHYSVHSSGREHVKLVSSGRQLGQAERARQNR